MYTLSVDVLQLAVETCGNHMKRTYDLSKKK